MKKELEIAFMSELVTFRQILVNRGRLCLCNNLQGLENSLQSNSSMKFQDLPVWRLLQDFAGFDQKCKNLGVRGFGANLDESWKSLIVQYSPRLGE